MTELNSATVFPFGVDYQVLRYCMYHVIETQEADLGFSEHEQKLTKQGQTHVIVLGR